jgi:hypothetical protein
MKLGLDELLIVNPGMAPEVTPGTPPPATSWFLGDDGGVYRIDSQLNDTALGDADPVPRYFLGEDGVLYETR